MSVVVALKVGDKVVVGCDSRASLEGRVITDDMSKIFYNKAAGIAIGGVGDLSEVQRIFRDLESGTIEIVGDAAGHLTFKDGGDPRGNASLLIAHKGMILTRDTGGAMLTRGDYAVIGDGGDIAAGAIEMAIKRGLVSKSDPRRVVKEATAIASKLSVHCGGKIRTYVV